MLCVQMVVCIVYTLSFDAGSCQGWRGFGGEVCQAPQSYGGNMFSFVFRGHVCVPACGFEQGLVHPCSRSRAGLVSTSASIQNHVPHRGPAKVFSSWGASLFCRRACFCRGLLLLC